MSNYIYFNYKENETKKRIELCNTNLLTTPSLRLSYDSVVKALPIYKQSIWADNNPFRLFYDEVYSVNFECKLPVEQYSLWRPYGVELNYNYFGGDFSFLNDTMDKTELYRLHITLPYTSINHVNDDITYEIRTGADYRKEKWKISITAVLQSVAGCSITLLGPSLTATPCGDYTVSFCGVTGCTSPLTCSSSASAHIALRAAGYKW